MEETPVLPVFIRDRDFVVTQRKEFSLFEMSQLLAHCVTFDCIEGCQKIGALWRIYFKANEARTKILTEGITVGDQLLCLVTMIQPK